MKRTLSISALLAMSALAFGTAASAADAPAPAVAVGEPSPGGVKGHNNDRRGLTYAQRAAVKREVMERHPNASKAEVRDAVKDRLHGADRGQVKAEIKDRIQRRQDRRNDQVTLPGGPTGGVITQPGGPSGVPK